MSAGIESTTLSNKYGMSATLGVFLLTILNVFDYVATRFALQRGAVELNPIFNYLYNMNVVFPLLMKLGFLSILAIMVSGKKQSRIITGLIWFAVGIYSALAIYHITLWM